MAKRKMSIAQKAALAKGRRALAQKRRGQGMAGKAKKSSRASSGGRGRNVVVVSGIDGMAGKKRRRRHRSRSMYGELLGATVKPKAIQAAALDIGVTLGGAILGALIAGRIPIKDPRIKAAVTMAAGIAGASMSKQAMVQHISNGIAIGGGLALVRSLMPQLGLAGGEELVIDENLKREIAAMLPAPQTMGAAENDVEQYGAIEGEEYETAGEIEGEEIEGEEYETAGEIEGEEIEGEDQEVYTGYLTQATM